PFKSALAHARASVWSRNSATRYRIQNFLFHILRAAGNNFKSQTAVNSARSSLRAAKIAMMFLWS
ncbi:MAG: hypothetical protein M3384_13155, partial [Acidobacteriota bacterium]|nr:hypothetical protein [Acidobacteriota bacterium]